MSIWPVRLEEWFPLGHENHDTAMAITEVLRCCVCGENVKFHKAIGHHSLPWGYGELWCSWKCCNGLQKRAKPDKRYERRIKRRISGEN